MALPNPIYISNVPAFQPSGASTILPCSAPTFSSPVDGVNISYILKEDYMCLANYFALLPLNTPHPDYGDFLLCSESPREDIGGGCVKWTRTYAKIPQPYNQPTTFNYNFIGYGGFGTTGEVGNTSPSGSQSGLTTVYGRYRITKTVPARVQYDYFLLDQTTGNITDVNGLVVYDGPSGVMPSPTNVPTIEAQAYYRNYPSAVTIGAFGDYLLYSYAHLPLPYQTGNGQPTTIPTRETYEAWIAASVEIVAQDSTITRWNASGGNIIERQTIYVKAE